MVDELETAWTRFVMGVGWLVMLAVAARCVSVFRGSFLAAVRSVAAKRASGPARRG